MGRSGSSIWVPALIGILLVSFHLFASRLGKALRGMAARKRAKSVARRRAGDHEYMMSTNESIDPE
jgi:hypothetical protein